MKYYKIVFVLLACSLVGCGDFDEMNKNPYQPTDVTAPMLSRSLIQRTVRKASGGDKYFTYDQMLSKYFTWTEGAESDVFNKLGTADADYWQIPAGDDMVGYASEDYKDAYQGVAHFVKVWEVYDTSMKLGDVPYSEAGLAREGLIRPKYDTQKEVMIGVLEELDLSYACFAKATKDFDGDPVYNGSLDKWKKAVTAFQLKVFMSLSKKEADGDLNIKSRFSNAISSKSLMTSNDDNFQVVYQNKAGMYYPYCRINSTQYKGPALSSVLVDPLKEFNDYRLFYYAEPATALLEEGYKASDFEAYIGIDPSMDYGEQSKMMVSGMMCYLNNRYVENFAGEPVQRLGYAEQQFILAEAALRGWISGDASTYYKKGIEAAMKFVADNTPAGEGYEHDRPITPTYIQEYQTQSAIQLNGNFEHDLELIIVQKYLAGLLQYKYDQYFEYRRTGYPKFPINPATNMNDEGYKDRIPVRWRYAQAQYNSNRENLQEALERQFNGQDSNNDLMWILK